MDTTIKARLGIDTTNWRGEVTSVGEDVKRLRGAVDEGRAAVTKYEQSMRAASGGTKEQSAALKDARDQLAQYNAELKRAERAQKDYQAAAESTSRAAAASAPKLPDESDRYEAHWKRLEEEDRSRKAQQAMAKVQAPEATPTDDSARYEAYWKSLEEKERSARSKGAIQAQEDASAAEQQRRKTDLEKFRRDRLAMVRQAGAEEEREMRTPGGRASSQPDEEGSNPHGSGSSRMASLEAGHSVRAIFDSLGAGIPIGQIASMELPRLLQAAGKGLGVSIGVEAAAMIVKGIGNAIQQDHEQKREFREALSSPAGLSTSTTEGLESQANRYAEAREKLTPDPDRWETIGQQLFRGIQFLSRKATGQKTVGEERDDQTEALEKRRINASEELAVRKAEEVKLNQEAFAFGEREVAMDRLKLSLRERINAVMQNSNIDEHARSRIIDNLREQVRLEERIKQIEIERENNARARRTQDVRGDHVGLWDGSAVTQTVDVNPAWTKNNRSLRHALNARDEAKANLDTVLASGGDSTEARQAFDDAEARVRDSAIDEELKTPGQRQNEVNQQRERDAAERRLMARSGMHPWYDGSTKPNGSTKAREAEGNLFTPEHLPGHEPPEHLPGHGDIPDNVSPSFDDLLRRNVHPWDHRSGSGMEMPQASNDAGNADLVAAFNAAADRIVHACSYQEV